MFPGGVLQLVEAVRDMPPEMLEDIFMMQGVGVHAGGAGAGEGGGPVMPGGMPAFEDGIQHLWEGPLEQPVDPQEPERAGEGLGLGGGEEESEGEETDEEEDEEEEEVSVSCFIRLSQCGWADDVVCAASPASFEESPWEVLGKHTC